MKYIPLLLFLSCITPRTFTRDQEKQVKIDCINARLDTKQINEIKADSLIKEIEKQYK